MTIKPERDQIQHDRDLFPPPERDSVRERVRQILEDEEGRVDALTEDDAYNIALEAWFDELHGSWGRD